MNAALRQFSSSYARAFEAYLSEPSEATLHRSYELGREAVSRSLSVMDVATVHHDALAANAAAEEGSEQRLTRAREFFVESLGAFEMVQRGFHEAREAALVERRHAEMLRQLSNFLTDASVAIHASDVLEEVLQLVAEQARELTHADCCLALLAGPADLPGLVATSCADERSSSAAFLRRTDPASLHDRALATLAGRHPHGESKAAPPLTGWISASLAGLDGRTFGSVHAIDGEAPFTDLDEAVLVHLAQMASAAIERALLYEGRL